MSADVRREFQKALRSYILYCLETTKRLYGVAPFEIFVELVNKNYKKDLETEEIRKILKEIPVEYMEFIVKDNKLYHKELYPDDRGLLKAQGNKPYYIPTKEEIMDIGMNGYLSGNEYIQRFQKYLIRKLGAMEDEA